MAESIRFQEVNIALGDKMSEFFTNASELTYSNLPEGLLDMSGVAFGSPPQINGDYLQGVTYGLQLDGIGTKPEISERLNEHRGAAFDLLAMLVDDAAASGGEVLAVGNLLDVRELNSDDEVTISGIHQLAEGMVLASKDAHVAVIGGEIAELGKRIGGYGSFNYNWGGVAFVATRKDRKLTGSELQPGHTLVGFAEPGFRSNGITDVRNAMEKHYGPSWHEQVEPSLGNIALGKLMQTPATIYAKLTRVLQGGVLYEEPAAEITGVAHITGGGQPSKLGRMLLRTEGLGITIDNPIEPPDAMLHVQRLCGFDDRKAYGKWHMGPGMVGATPEPQKVLAEADDFGIVAQEIGQVTDEPGIRIKNRGAVQQEEWLVF